MQTSLGMPGRLFSEVRRSFFFAVCSHLSDSLGYDAAMWARDLIQEMNHSADPERAEFFARFFKAGAGEYGEGDKFLGGFTVPAMRKLARKYAGLSLTEVQKLLRSRFHEHRFVALEILVHRYERGDAAEKQKVFRLYLANRRFINNWDLVDTSVQYIVGDYLSDRSKSLLYRMARSRKLFERRMAIVATFAYIRNGQFEDAVAIAKILLHDRHDLIHKAVGWMLREVGKRSLNDEIKFLNAHAAEMPRTMLRYAIERFPERQRKFYLQQKFTAK